MVLITRPMLAQNNKGNLFPYLYSPAVFSERHTGCDFKTRSSQRKRGSMYVSEKLPTYPSLNLTLTLTSRFGKNVRFGAR